MEVLGKPWDKIAAAKPLSPLTLEFLTGVLKFPTMAPVQAQAIPQILGGRDVVAEAVTGSGKTLAYAVPAIEFLLMPSVVKSVKNNRQAVVAVIIVPSRELASQVYQVLNRFVGFIASKTGVGYSCCCFVGGRDVKRDIETFSEKGGSVLVGTPGRLFELLVEGGHKEHFDLRTVEFVVLDEADRLLEMGFQNKLDQILKRFPKQRRTGLFSATQTKELADLARTGMRNPVSVSVRVTSATTVDDKKPQIPVRLTNAFAVVKNSEKFDVLVSFLSKHANQKVLVYVLTCAAVDWMTECLKHLAPAAGLDKEAIFGLHGQMDMKRRRNMHKTVTKRSNAVLVCTDVASRGLDIPEIATVIQYDPPVDPSTFIHRIGRTGRMGRDGFSLVFLCHHELEYIPFLTLQNVLLSPYRGEDADAVDAVNASTAEGGSASGVDPSRTLQEALQKTTVMAHQRKKAAEIKEQLRKLKRQRVQGDLCESESILTLRRAATTHPELIDLALRAFVSFIRAYKEHSCRYIFSLRKLDITDLVHAFALFRVPNCSEIRKMSHLVIPLQEEFKEISARCAKDAKDKKRAREEKEAAEDGTGGGADDVEAPKRRFINERKEVLKHEALTKNERHRAWQIAELDDLKRDAYYIKKERSGRLSKKKTDEILGTEAQENALLSTRERKEAKREAHTHKDAAHAKKQVRTKK